MNKNKKGKVVYGFSREQKNKIEYHVYNSEEEKNIHKEEFSKGFSEFKAELVDAFGHSDILLLKFVSGKEVYITDPEFIKNFI